MGSFCSKYCTCQRMQELIAECESLTASCQQKAAQIDQLMKELNDVKLQLAKILDLPPPSSLMS